MENFSLPARKESYRTKMLLEYITDTEGLFLPDGRYLRTSAKGYLNRLSKEVEPLPMANFLHQQQAAQIQAESAEATTHLTNEGWIGVAKAHSAFAAFEVVRSSSGLARATEYLSSQNTDKRMSNLQALLTSDLNKYLIDQFGREVLTKQYIEDLQKICSEIAGIDTTRD